MLYKMIIALTSGLTPWLFVVLGLITLWFLKMRSRKYINIPPIPVKPYPLLGHAPMLGSDALKTFGDWRKISGDIYSIYLGQQLTVVLNSYEVMKEALVKNAEYMSDRCHRFVDLDPRFDGGIVDTSGPLWKEQRTVTMNILKELGLGKNWIGERIGLEVEAYLEVLTKLKGEPTDLKFLTASAVANVICAMLIGHRLNYEDPVLCNLLSLLTEQMSYLSGTSVLTCFPWLQHLPGDLFHGKRMLEIEDTYRLEYSQKFIKQIKESNNSESVPNLINGYLKEEKKRKKIDNHTTLNEHNLTMVITNLFQAGTETTTTTLLWAMLYSLHNQDVQEKVYQEIMEVVGPDRLPILDDKPRMNYTVAFIMETQRLGNLAPLGLPHRCNKDTLVSGYTIPAGTKIVMNFTAVMHDTKIWGDPMVFRPERFLDMENNLTTPDQFIPFGIGRRYCMGESLARAELFLFVTSIFQRFKLRPEDPDNLPLLEPVLGITCSPQSYKARLVDRRCE